ncbi:MAG: sigma 54-interacting transcriptional regulator [Candidatus Adiutrix sp.]|jgi:two-component system NtrC family response regulator|nr:sigma 54-interacting transcriptional regulator [Candidatus Adiutrix sp.]
METILIVDDERNYHLPLTSLFRHEGYETISAYSGNEAWAIVQERDVDLVLSDMTMPDGDGLELLSHIKEHTEIPVLMLTALGAVDTAVEAMKRGASDYLTKPFNNDELLVKVANALEKSRLGRENKELRSALTTKYNFDKLVGKSKPMQELFQLLEKVSPTKANVLITGESGTGKELVAQALHYNSPRKDGPFVAVNCSALSPTLLESELFGHEKGAFTDARQSRAGRFELAGGGSLFLDEIGEMDPGLQVKLLRVIQERRFERVGGSQSLAMDVRLMAATNRDLKKEVAAGRFREDLFYRLNVVHLHLPPLRERLDDLPLLVRHFLKMYGEDSGQPPKTMSTEALRLMYAYGWPGNIRELGNIVERGVVLSSGPEIFPDDLPDDLRQPSVEPPAQPAPPAAPATAATVEMPSPATAAGQSWVAQILADRPEEASLDDMLSALEECLIRAAMKTRGGVQSHAAQDLGVPKNTFKYKWDNYAGREPSPLSLTLEGETPPGLGLNEAKDALEEALLREALERTGGVQSQAADLLGIKKNLMQYKLKKFSINPKEESAR